ncbi:MAG: hypothetical protein PHE12_02595 [Clostridia bacterium]|nr:hypothetical protein [Clostridia bacterium]
MLVFFFCFINLLRARLAVDYFSNAFLMLINLAIALCVLYYISKSGYKLTEKEILIKIAFFKDPLSYDKIKKIYYYATEEELYIELNNSAEKGIVKININNKDMNVFVNELKKRLPDVPYEVSLKMQADDE